MQQITIDLSGEQLASLDNMVARSGKNREELAQEALEKFLIQEEHGKEFLDSLLEGIADADAGNFATDAEVAAVFQKYGTRR